MYIFEIYVFLICLNFERQALPQKWPFEKEQIQLFLFGIRTQTDNLKFNITNVTKKPIKQLHVCIIQSYICIE